jgi:hypothetical protein
MQSRREELPLVCSIENAEQKRERGDELAALFANATGFEELENGYAFSFESTAQWGNALLEFILFEKQCCSFFTFELNFAPQHGPLVLRWTGPDGAKDMLAPLVAARENV